MLAKRIIPCLDVREGRVVKGVNFVGIRDAGDPVECAQNYDRQGADELVFLDITASHEKRGIMIKVVEAVASCIFIPFTVGGGIQGLSDIRDILNAGSDKVSINTTAVKDPDIVAAASARFGSQCIVVAIDAKRNEGDSWDVYTHGGRNNAGRDAVEWAKTVAAAGAGEILLTSMDRDGTKDGYDLALTKAIADVVDIPVIASGGAGTLAHLRDVLCDAHADAVLAASIFHYNEYTVGDVKEYLVEQGISVRKK